MALMGWETTQCDPSLGLRQSNPNERETTFTSLIRHWPRGLRRICSRRLWLSDMTICFSKGHAFGLNSRRVYQGRFSTAPSRSDQVLIVRRLRSAADGCRAARAAVTGHRTTTIAADAVLERWVQAAGHPS